MKWFCIRDIENNRPFFAKTFLKFVKIVPPLTTPYNKGDHNFLGNIHEILKKNVLITDKWQSISLQLSKNFFSLQRQACYIFTMITAHAFFAYELGKKEDLI